MYTYPFQIIKKRLEDQVPELKVVDWFLDQFNKRDKSVQIHTEPGVYVEFRTLAMQQLSYGHQMTEAEIVLHLFGINMYDNHKRVQKENDRDHAVLVDYVHKAMSGFSARLSYLPEFGNLLNTSSDKMILGSMRRTELKPPHAIRSIQITEQTYTALIFDDGAVKPRANTVQPLHVTVTIH